MADLRQNRFLRHGYFKSWPVLALGRCLHRLCVGEAARTPKRHHATQVAVSDGFQDAASLLEVRLLPPTRRVFKKASTKRSRPMRSV